MCILVVALLALALAGCSASGTRSSVRLTEHQRDSILATQKAVPGSATIGRALELQAGSGDRASGLDSLVR